VRGAPATPPRTRRHFEQHLRLVAPQRRYFEALAAAAPGRVLILDAGADGPPVRAVAEALGALPAHAPDAAWLLEQVLAWVGAQEPVDG
jgi:hypothetical protein